jgi:hypothetical protein
MMRVFTSMKWTIMFSIALGMFISGIFAQPIKDAYLEYYDAAYPVVAMRGDLVAQDDDAVTIRISGEKLRPCRYLRMLAYTTKNGQLTDAYHERAVGVPDDSITRPVGKMDIGFWRIYPKGNADAVSVYVQHDCGGGRITTTQTAEVHLK